MPIELETELITMLTLKSETHEGVIEIAGKALAAGKQLNEVFVLVHVLAGAPNDAFVCWMDESMVQSKRDRCVDARGKQAWGELADMPRKGDWLRVMYIIEQDWDLAYLIVPSSRLAAVAIQPDRTLN
jgi:hypothetical protein